MRIWCFSKIRLFLNSTITHSNKPHESPVMSSRSLWTVFLDVYNNRRCSPCTRPPGWWSLCGHGSTDSSLWRTSGPTERSSCSLLSHNGAEHLETESALGQQRQSAVPVNVRWASVLTEEWRAGPDRPSVTCALLISGSGLTERSASSQRPVSTQLPVSK